MMNDITALTRYGINEQGVFTNNADGAYVSYQDYMALVEALEKAQTEREEFRNRLKLERSILEDADKRIAELEGTEQKLCAANVTLDARAELAERRLAELESCTVTVKLPKLYGMDFCDRIVPDSRNGFLFYSEQVVDALTAAGIQVIEGEGQ